MIFYCLFKNERFMYSSSELSLEECLIVAQSIKLKTMVSPIKSVLIFCDVFVL